MIFVSLTDVQDCSLLEMQQNENFRVTFGHVIDETNGANMKNACVLSVIFMWIGKHSLDQSWIVDDAQCHPT